eukprot:364462-Chlamydomonas_euryale.AAC.12
MAPRVPQSMEHPRKITAGGILIKKIQIVSCSEHSAHHHRIACRVGRPGSARPAHSPNISQCCAVLPNAAQCYVHCPGWVQHGFPHAMR